MSLNVSGMIVIPQEPKLEIVKPESGSGYFLNFQAVTQGKAKTQKVEYQYWNCSVWIPDIELPKWEENLVSGQVFYVEHATAISIPVMDGKYHNVKIKLDHNFIKKLTKPLWQKD
jgi:hypothetical protein